MKKTLGRLAGAVLASALISLAVVPAANADPVTDTSSSAPADAGESTPPSESPASETTPPVSSPATSAPATETGTPTETSAPTETGNPTETGKPTETGQPTDTSKPTTPTTTSSETPPEEPPYVDDIAYGVDLDGNDGVFVIACAAGEPTNVHSKDFDLVEGPYQFEDDGRYWGWTVKRHEGVSFDNGIVYASWTCGTKPTDGGHVPPAGGAGAGSAGTTGGHGDSQVKYAPKHGIETGFGGMAA
ncbi:hypothetical protein [Amycolatopsis echigonensis]|uniref:Secreted protein n=1 Tax=Amycolatopsis echigonensis TaxID=2576905 RepID=A0A8E1T3X5_9PSEU|nr:MULTISPECIES: hypothetical protein [Amycolatopsis]MBB2497997.1 hypothetical protein [Amycolatopsis echigonensis]